MLTIAVLNQKGGVGKTTIATNLAAAAHLDGRRTLLVDLDDQETAYDWSIAHAEGSKLEGIAAVKVDKKLTIPLFGELTAGFDVVLLDGPARLGNVTRSAAVAADVAVLPVQPGPFDFWACDKTIHVLDEADAIRAELKREPVRRLFVVNRAMPRTVLALEAPAALAEKGEVSPVVLHQRIALTEAQKIGESVLTTEPKGRAASEIRALYKSLTKPSRRTS